MQLGVELAPDAVASGDDLAGPVPVVATEDGVGDARQGLSLDPGRSRVLVARRVRHRLGTPPGSVAPVDPHQAGALDVVACSHAHPVSDGDTESALRLKQAVLADGYDDVVATGEGAHDGGTAADVGASPDDDAGRETTFDHARSEGASVEVDESLGHDRGSFGQVGTQPHAVGVDHAHPGGRDVVEHVRELVHQVDSHVAAVLHEHQVPDLVEDRSIEDAEIGPDVVVQDPEDAVQVDPVGLDVAHRQQVQPEVGVTCCRRRLVEVLDRDHHRDAVVVAEGGLGQHADLMSQRHALESDDVGVTLLLAEGAEVVDEHLLDVVCAERLEAGPEGTDHIGEHGGCAEVALEVDVVELDGEELLAVAGVAHGGHAESEGGGCDVVVSLLDHLRRVAELDRTLDGIG